ncbi:DUF3237 family protein [Sphingorhabdus sp.]|uniref:DUF3237 family protein n=1 Tax=Sphingorhabdus sp. TaxID=1902408 RepID=UPI0038FD1C23
MNEFLQAHCVASNELMRINLEMSAPVTISTISGITKRLVPIFGGEVYGDNFAGTVIGGGADWQEIHPDGSLEINARYVLNLNGGLVEVSSRGLRTGSAEILEQLNRGEQVDPRSYYFRTAIRFTTTTAELMHLNKILAISTGERNANVVKLTVYEVI